MQLQSAIEGYWLEKQRNLSVNTVADYTNTFKRFQSYIGPQTAFAAITSDQVRKFLNYLKTQHRLKSRTIANAWIALSSLWTWAEHELNTPHIIRGKVERPKFKRQPIEPSSRTDIAAMLEACHHAKAWKTKTGRQAAATRPTALRDRAIITTLLDTGMRASELCDLKLDDYDNTKGQLLIRHGKGDKGRFVYLGAGAKKHLWKYLATRPNAAPKEPLFTCQDLTHFDRNNLRHLIQRCAKRAGVANATLHKFRHTFAINFLRNGGNLLQLQTLLGHERMDTVRIYAQLAQSDLELAQAKASPADNWNL
jgi:integrase/recombinase XerD